jgi:site-specific recombinase XerD
MIVRQNWLDLNSYLDYHEHTLLRSLKTIARKHNYLHHLLEWAEATPFPAVAAIKPVFSAYLLVLRIGKMEAPLSPAGMKRTCAEAQNFFRWMAVFEGSRYKSIDPLWIEPLRPPHRYDVQSELQELVYFSPDEVLALCELQPERLIEQRDQAAAAFLFLSGMRIDAFVSLPIRGVDLVRMRVKQLPKWGVRTKNHKAAITFLYQIPKLLTIVQAWDLLVRSELDVNSPWYAYLSTDGRGFDGTLEASAYRRQDFARGLKHLCKQAEIAYRSPHAFRHGHGVFGVQHARNVEELKAVSQNMMHKALTTTDSMYGNPHGENVRSVITSLGQKKEDQITISGDVVRLAQVFKALLENQDWVDDISDAELFET